MKTSEIVAIVERETAIPPLEIPIGYDWIQIDEENSGYGVRMYRGGPKGNPAPFVTSYEGGSTLKKRGEHYIVSVLGKVLDVVHSRAKAKDIAYVCAVKRADLVKSCHPKLPLINATKSNRRKKLFGSGKKVANP